MNTDLYIAIKKRVRSDIVTDIFEFDDTSLTMSIPLVCGPKLGFIKFHINPNLYYININDSVMLNAAEEQNITEEEVIGDIREIVKAVDTRSLQLTEYSFFRRRAYSVGGLNPKRFARTKTLGEALIQGLGLRGQTCTVKFPSKTEKEF